MTNSNINVKKKVIDYGSLEIRLHFNRFLRYLRNFYPDRSVSCFLFINTLYMLGDMHTLQYMAKTEADP